MSRCCSKFKEFGLCFLLLSDSRQFYEIDEFKHKILVPIITETEKARRRKKRKTCIASFFDFWYEFIVDNRTINSRSWCKNIRNILETCKTWEEKSSLRESIREVRYITIHRTCLFAVDLRQNIEKLDEHFMSCITDGSHLIWKCLEAVTCVIMGAENDL